MDRELSELDERSMSKLELATIFYATCIIYLDNKEYEKAETYILKGLELVYWDMQYYVQAAVVYFFWGKVDKSKYEKGINT